MSDAKLRDLERRWRETGTVEDEAAYLRMALRHGVDVDVVDLAALCGNAAARLVRPRVGTPKRWVKAEEAVLLLELQAPLGSVLDRLSVSFVRDAWRETMVVAEQLSLEPGRLRHCGVSSTLFPPCPPDRVSSPLDYFGWGTPLPWSDARSWAQRLLQTVGPWGLVRPTLATERRRFLLDCLPDDHVSGLFALCEWALGDQADWQGTRHVGPTPAANALVEIAMSSSWWEQDFGLPFGASDGEHPLAPVMGAVLSQSWLTGR